MKVYNVDRRSELDPELINLLTQLRARRSFDTERYLLEKVEIINRYFSECGLTAGVVAVSGGIDSAVVLALMSRASREKNSPIKKLIAAMLPIFDDQAATNQSSALARGTELAKKFQVESVAIDLTSAYNALKQSVDTATKIKGQSWASGQLVSYIRTPALYYITSLLTQEGYSGVVCGTTNRDEGAYLGYVGKASDGMVDLQLISDLHKSEVYNLARKLDIPESIIKAVPAGDMYDGRVDEEVFGASYDFVELYLLFKSTPDEEWKESILAGLSSKARKQFDLLAENLEALHHYNQHKYYVGSPAVHLDIYESAVPGGWSERKYVFKESKNKI